MVALNRNPLQAQLMNCNINNVTCRMESTIKSSSFFVNLYGNRVSFGKLSFLKCSNMFYNTFNKSYFFNKKFSGRGLYRSLIIRLSAALWVENCLIKDNNISSLFTGKINNFGSSS